MSDLNHNIETLLVQEIQIGLHPNLLVETSPCLSLVVVSLSSILSL